MLNFAQFFFNFAAQCRQVALREANIVLGVLNCFEVFIGNVHGAPCGGEHVNKRALAPGTLVGDAAGFIELLFRLVERRGGNIDVVGDGLNHLRWVALAQLRKGLLGWFNACPNVDGARSDGVNFVAGAHEYPAHLVELGGFVAQRLLCLPGG